MSGGIRLFILIFFLSGIYVFIFGESGVLERLKLQDRNDKIASEIIRLENNSAALAARLRQYQSSGPADGEELLESGFINAGDRIIYFKNNHAAESAVGPEPEKDAVLYTVEILHLRIIWGLFSVMVLILYLVYKNKHGIERKY